MNDNYSDNAELMAKLYGWTKTYTLPLKGIIAFKSKLDPCHMEIHINSKKIITCMEHPKGTTILERSNINVSEMRGIFIDPRIHTKKGVII